MKDLKYVHITKCAGTFIEEMGRDNNIKWGRHHKEYGWWHETFITKPEKIKNKYDWFVIVRNPYTRLLSEYYCQWGGINHESCKNIKIETNDDFNNYLIKKINSRNNKSDDKLCVGHHYTEQYKYIDNDIPMHVIKLENLNTELQVLFDKYNINIIISNYKKMNNKENKNDILPYTIDNFNEELINLINEVYDKDFQLFDYNKLVKN